jgi:hypothetical protein
MGKHEATCWSTTQLAGEQELNLIFISVRAAGGSKTKRLAIGEQEARKNRIGFSPSSLAIRMLA